MSSGNWMVDAHDREDRAKSHLCACGSDGYIEEPHCTETGDYCQDNCEFKNGQRSLIKRLLRLVIGVEPRPDQRCEFCDVLTFCARCGRKLDLE